MKMVASAMVVPLSWTTPLSSTENVSRVKEIAVEPGGIEVANVEFQTPGVLPPCATVPVPPSERDHAAEFAELTVTSTACTAPAAAMPPISARTKSRPLLPDRRSLIKPSRRVCVVVETCGGYTKAGNDTRREWRPERETARLR